MLTSDSLPQNNVIGKASVLVLILEGSSLIIDAGSDPESSSMLLLL